MLVNGKPRVHLLPAKVHATAVRAASYAVVSRGFAGALQGSALGAKGNGTLYAVFASLLAAQGYRSDNKMLLYTKVVTL